MDFFFYLGKLISIYFIPLNDNFSGFIPIAINFLRRLPIIGSILLLPGIRQVRNKFFYFLRQK